MRVYDAALIHQGTKHQIWTCPRLPILRHKARATVYEPLAPDSA